MFYLKSFSNIVKSHFVLMTFSVLVFSSFIGVLSFNQDITSFFSLDNKTNRSPYFNALISGKHNMESIQRKIEQLPGVESILIKEALDAKLEMEKIIPGIDVDETLNSQVYQPIKIFLNPAITKNSRQLIREYLTRLMGKESVTFSSVKYPAKVNLKKYPYFKIFSDWSGSYFAFIAFCLWIVATILVSPYFYQQAFVIEKFQRTKMVALKMYMGFIFSLSGIILIILNLTHNIFDISTLAIMAIGITISIITFNLSKYSSRRIV